MKCPGKNLKTPFCKSSAPAKCPEAKKHPHLHAVAKHVKKLLGK
jgi:hypothetical protein